jgi:peptidoglycan biosynthesis protein MviN/MurJ (putative lipid II flippase)
MPRSRTVASNVVITSISQASTMITGGLLALLVAVLIGNNARTDGFFAAFAVYSVVVTFAQSARTTVVARLLEGQGRFTALNHYFGAALLVIVLVSVAFGPLGGVVADLLTGDLPQSARETARTTLLILWPAAALQLFGALGAAMLGALGDFVWAGAAFMAGSLLAIPVFVVLEPSLGIDGVAVGMLIGSVISTIVVAVGLVRVGWRPAWATFTQPREAARAGRVLAISSFSFLIAQVGFIFMLAVGARLGVSVVTIFTYSFMAMSLVQALFVSSIPMVLAGPLALSWDRRPASLLPHNEAIFRAGLLLVVPVFAGAVLVGADVADLVLADFSDSEVHLFIDLFLILSANVVWGLIATVPYAAAVAIGRYTAVALLTLGVVALQVVLALVAGALDSVELLAAVVPVSTAVSVLGTCAVVSARYPLIAGPALAKILLRLSLAGAVAFALPALVAERVSLAAVDPIAFLVGLGLFALIVVKLLPAEREIAARLVATLPRVGQREVLPR